MGNFPSGGISYAFGSSNWDDEDIVPQADKRANAPMQIAQKIKLRKLSGFFALFPILASFGLLELCFVIVHRRVRRENSLTQRSLRLKRTKRTGGEQLLFCLIHIRRIANENGVVHVLGNTCVL